MRRSIRIKNRIPEGVFSYLFKPFSNYKYRLPRVREINNAFISHEGLVLKNFLLLSGTAFNISGFRDKNFYYQFWKTTILQYLTCKYGSSLPHRKLEGKDYTIVHTKWFNYGFWLNSSLSRLIKLEKSGRLPSTVLLIPENIYKKEFVRETLKAFNLEIEVITNGEHLFVQRYIHVETRDYSTEFYKEDLQEIRTKLVGYANKVVSRTDLNFKKIYLSRKEDRNVRLVANSEEIEQFLFTLGFKKIYFEDFSIWEQIFMMSRTERLIAIHGAGCVNIMFLPKNNSFIELINEPYAMKEYQFAFWKLAIQSDLVYYPLFCKPLDDNSKKLLNYGKYGGSFKETDFLVNKNLIVSIPKLQEALYNLKVK